ncbi:MAG: diacylglycerol kinase family lipid kinase [Thermoleophilia bacterium]|nr:diacylglycerol kinase family lipid kinase [Thermoleophilia bacterium]
MRAAVIYNPSAGRGRGGDIASAVERGLVKRGFEVDLHVTERPGGAMAIAERLTTEADVVVAVGGDGTINEVANGMAAAGRGLSRPATGETGAATGQGAADPGAAAEAGAAARPAGRRALLGIVPAGTVNVLALELGLPFQVERACNVIAGGKTISLDLGKVNGRGFVLMVGAGVDALTVRNIDLRAKRRYKELAFVSTGLRSGWAAPPPVFLTRVDGREYRTTFFVAGNSRYYAARLGMTPQADPTDGLLDLVLFTGTTRSSLTVFWLGVPSGLHLHNPNVTYLRARQAELLPLDDKEPIWFQTDGELAGRLPATVEIDAHALEVLVP